MTVQLLEYTGPDDAKRNKHGGVANEIDHSFTENFVVKQIYKGNKVDSGREDLCRVKKQRLHLAFDHTEGEKGVSGNHDNANIDQNQLCFPLPKNFLLLKANHSADKNPDQRDQDHGEFKRNLYHFYLLSFCVGDFGYG